MGKVCKSSSELLACIHTLKINAESFSMLFCLLRSLLMPLRYRQLMDNQNYFGFFSDTGNWNFRASKSTDPRLYPSTKRTISSARCNPICEQALGANRTRGMLHSCLWAATICDRAVPYWWLDWRMWIFPGFTYKFHQSPPLAVLKAVAAVLVSRRWHIICLHTIQYHLEKACTATNTNFMIWSAQAVLPVRTVKANRADSFSTFCAGGRRAACNMASVIQEGCVLQHAVRGSCYLF